MSMIRSTTGGVLRSYRSNLMHSFITLNKSRDTMLTQRNFNSYAEDPAAASRAFQMRRSLSRVESQYSVNNAVWAKYDTGFSAITGVQNLVKSRNEGDNAVAWDAVLRTLNDPSGDSRTALGKVLNQIADTVVQNMNTKDGETFIFAGADGLNVPFSFDASGKLLYRGVPVDAAVPDVLKDAASGIIKVNAQGEVDPAGTDYLKTAGTSVITVADYNQAGPDAPNVLKNADQTLYQVDKDGKPDPAGGYYLVVDNPPETISQADYEQAGKDVEKLKYMTEKEATFVDIGLGMKENGNQLIESSAFNSALQGVTFLGYGVDDEGDPKNIVSLLKKMGELCSTYKDEPWTTENQHYQEVNRLAGKLEDAMKRLDAEYTDLSAATVKVKNNGELLEESAYNLQEQIAAEEDVNMAEAISSFVWAQYCYNAALKVGNSILSQSLMDYLS